MLCGYICHILDSLVPAQTPQDHKEIQVGKKYEFHQGLPPHDFRRLEYLCACKIMSSIDIASRVLPQTPASLFPPLVKAFFMAKFYGEPQGSESMTLLPLNEVLLWWPGSSFVLLNLLPKLPPRHDSRLSVRNQKARIVELMSTVFSHILHIYLIRLCSDKLNNPCPVSCLDISGLLPNKYPICHYMLKKLEETVKILYEPNAPQDQDKREVVLDVDVTEEECRRLRVVCELGQRAGAGLRVTLGRVQVTSVSSSQLESLLHALSHTKVHTLEIERCKVENETLELLPQLSQSLKGVSFAYTRGITDLKFLTQLSNLQQLNLTGMRLRGKCEVLGNLAQDLEYLNLTGCFLKGPDLDVLTKTKHVLSLHQLDLSENGLGDHTESAALCRLCQTLPKVSVLELEHCGLEKMSQPVIETMVSVLAALPSLSLLQLVRNDLPIRTWMRYLPTLATSPVLSCVCLTVPSEAYISDNYADNENTICSLKENLNQSLQAIRSPPPCLDWTEESSFSCWYYTVGL